MRIYDQENSRNVWIHYQCIQLFVYGYIQQLDNQNNIKKQMKYI